MRGDDLRVSILRTGSRVRLREVLGRAPVS